MASVAAATGAGGGPACCAPEPHQSAPGALSEDVAGGDPVFGVLGLADWCQGHDGRRALAFVAGAFCHSRRFPGLGITADQLAKPGSLASAPLAGDGPCVNSIAMYFAPSAQR